MADVLWYYEDGATQVGPVSPDALAEAIRFGRLPRGRRVWRVGFSGWQFWESIPELAALGPPAPPPPPAPAFPPANAHRPDAAPPAASASPPFSANSYAADVLTGGGAASLYPRAPLGGRFAAALIDNLVSAVPAGVLFAAAYGAGGSLAAVFGVLAGIAVIWAVYYMFTKDGRPGGQSIGKKAMGLMVVHLPTNQPCSVGQSAIRYLVLFGLNLIPYVGWLVEPVVTLAAAGGRRLGDNAAGTQVIAVADHRRRL